MHAIVANSVLPARRHPVSLLTEDGVRLVGEWSLPLDDDPRAVIVFAHPLPTPGGLMDSHVLRKVHGACPRWRTCGAEVQHPGDVHPARDERGHLRRGPRRGPDLAAAIEGRRQGCLTRGWSAGRSGLT